MITNNIRLLITKKATDLLNENFRDFEFYFFQSKSWGTYYVKYFSKSKRNGAANALRISNHRGGGGLYKSIVISDSSKMSKDIYSQIEKFINEFNPFI